MPLPGIWSADHKMHAKDDATVVDMHRRRVAGLLTSHSDAPGGTLGLVVIPIFLRGDADKVACAALGKAVGRFLLQKGESAPGID